MGDIILTFQCATSEVDTIVKSLRTCTSAPIHVRQETVHGRDFSDAKITEQVTGTLLRAAIEVVAHTDQLSALTNVIRDARRAHPVRWHAAPLIAHGRIA